MTKQCSNCGESFEPWGLQKNRVKRCLNCANKNGLLLSGEHRTGICRLCNKKFEKPLTLNGSKIFCSKCGDIEPNARCAMIRKKKGLPSLKRYDYYNSQYHREKKVVDNHEYIPVLTIAGMSVEKMERAIADKNVIFTGIPGGHR